MGITYVSGELIENMPGMQIEQQASTPVASAATGHAVLWVSTANVWNYTDPAGNVVPFVTTTGTQTLTNKTLTQPTIGDFTLATHSHQNNAGGGQLAANLVFASGQVPLARGGTNADLSATGGSNRFLKQTSAGAAVSVATIASADLTTALTTPPAIGGATPAAGTFSGLTVSATAPSLVITGTAGNARSLFWQTGGANRFVFYINTTAESGANAGSDLALGGYGDGGGFLNNYMTFTRSSGDVAFTGTMSKGGGSFLIDHPLDPDNRDLIHSFIEGPRADLIYRGTVRLKGGKGKTSIDAASGMTPGTFEALTRHAEIWAQNQSGWDVVRGRVVGGEVEIECQNPASTDEVTWLVIAERNDEFYRHSSLTDTEGQFVVERDKLSLSADELASLEPVENADSDTDTLETLPSLIGKKGYRRHAYLTGGGHIPQREVRSSKETKGDTRRTS